MLGNLQPMTRNFKQDSVYAKLLAVVTARQDRLIETLSPEQKELFDAANEATIDLSVENDQDLFVKGFVLGAQLMLEGPGRSFFVYLQGFRGISARNPMVFNHLWRTYLRVFRSRIW